MDVPERLPPRPLRYRGRGFGAKAPLRKPKFISAFLPQAWLPPRPFASSRTRGSRLPGPLPSRPLCHRRRVFGAKAPPTEAHFCRSGFSRDLLRHREPGVRGCRGSSRRDPCVIENHGFRIAGAAFTTTLLAIEAESSGLKPLLQEDRCLVGAALAATLRHREPSGSKSSEPLPLRPLRRRAESSGLKPLLQKPMLGRSGFSRDPCVIENHGFGIAGAAFTATLFAIEAESSGLKPLLQEDRCLVGAALAATLRHREPSGSKSSEPLPL
jgi:hypothetical protein